MLGEHGRSITKTLFTKPALAMAKVGITPNMLTVTGTVLSIVVAVCTLPQGYFLLGVGLLLIVLFGESWHAPRAHLLPLALSLIPAWIV